MATLEIYKTWISKIGSFNFSGGLKKRMSHALTCLSSPVPTQLTIHASFSNIERALEIFKTDEFRKGFPESRRKTFPFFR